MGQIASIGLPNFFNNKEKYKEETSNFYFKFKSEFDSFAREQIDAKSLTAINAFVTPRLPLKRSRPDSQGVHHSTSSQLLLDIISPCKRVKMEERYLEFPFLEDQLTVDYLQKCKVIFIMRGLPGSGKSTIVKALRRKYPFSQCCSADDYFMVEGEYMYDASKIGEAHNSCQKNSVKAAVAQIKMIIIDNTHTKLWELKFYLDLANTFNYFPIIVEPKTPWQSDANSLTEKNTHKVSKEVLALKMKHYEDLHPLYCGWFLNEMDSYLLNVEGQSWISEAFSFDVFKKSFAANYSVRSVKDFMRVYRKPGGNGLYHCTSQYGAAYAYSKKAEDAVGRHYELHIVGFIITPRTFGARVKLTPEQECLWRGADDEDIPQSFWDQVAKEDTHLRAANETEFVQRHQESDLLSEVEVNGQLGENLIKSQEVEKNAVTNDIDSAEDNVAHANLIQHDIDIDYTNLVENDAFIASDVSPMAEVSLHQNNGINNHSEVKNDCDAYPIHDTDENFAENNLFTSIENDDIISSNFGCDFGDIENDEGNNRVCEIGTFEGFITELQEKDDSCQEIDDSTDALNIEPNSTDALNIEPSSTAALNIEPSSTDALHIEPSNEISNDLVALAIETTTENEGGVLHQELCANGDWENPRVRKIPVRRKGKMGRTANKVTPSKSIKSVAHKSPAKKTRSVSIPENLVKPQNSRVTASIKEVPLDVIKNKFHPIEGRGRRAHITLGCRGEMKPVTTGLDLLFAHRLEELALVEDQQTTGTPGLELTPDKKAVLHTLELKGATLRNYGSGVWVVYLEKKLVLSSLFNMAS